MARKSTYRILRRSKRYHSAYFVVPRYTAEQQRSKRGSELRLPLWVHVVSLALQMSLSPASLCLAFDGSYTPPQIQRAVPYIVRQHQRNVRGTQLYEATRKHLHVGDTRLGIVCIKGVWILIHRAWFAVLHSERNAWVRVVSGVTEHHRTLHAGSSCAAPDGLLHGPRPTFISVFVKEGCWPVFTTAEDARRFCPTKWPLETVPVGKATRLYYGGHNGRYVCIECHQLFRTVGDICTHVGVPTTYHTAI